MQDDQEQDAIDKLARDRALDESIDKIVQHLASNELEAAMAACREALVLQPDYAPAIHMMGMIAYLSGDVGLAIQLVSRAAELEPDWREYVSMLAYLDALAGRVTDALYHAKLATALEPHPRHRRLIPANTPLGAQVFEHVGISTHRIAAELAFDNGHFAEAVREGELELNINADSFETMQVLARALLALGRFDAALNHLRAAAHLEPGSAAVQRWMGDALLAAGRRDQALEAFRRARAAAPEDEAVAAHCLTALGWLDDAGQAAAQPFADELRAGIETARRPRNFTYGRYPQIAVVWDQIHAGPLMDFVLPVLREMEDVIVYRLNRRFDDASEAVRATVMRQVDAYNLDPPTFDRIVSGDRPRALINLCAATDDAKYPLLTGEGAPLRLQWLGLPLPDRLPAVDGTIGSPETADIDTALFDPARTVKLPQLLAWRFPATGVEAEAVVPPPRDATGVVTFGAFGDLRRITPATASLWARVLLGVPGSQLLLGGAVDWQRSAANHLLELFANSGVANRISLQRDVPAAGVNLAFYASIDVLLDTAPVNGLTEVAEALWMGVPVVSLRGRRRAGRSGAAILGAAGRGEWAVGDAEAYVTLAAELATGEGLAGLRAGLREATTASPLCDTKTFAGGLRAAIDDLTPPVGG